MIFVFLQMSSQVRALLLQMTDWYWELVIIIITTTAIIMLMMMIGDGLSVDSGAVLETRLWSFFIEALCL